MSATLTLTKLDVLRVFRNSRYLIFAIAMPAALYLIIGKQTTHADGVEFKAYYMLAMATYGAFAGALMNNSHPDRHRAQVRLDAAAAADAAAGRGYVFAKVVTSLATTIPSVLVVFARRVPAPRAHAGLEVGRDRGDPVVGLDDLRLAGGGDRLPLRPGDRRSRP